MTDVDMNTMSLRLNCLSPLQSFPGVRWMIERAQSPEDRVCSGKHIVFQQDQTSCIRFDFDCADKEGHSDGTLLFIVRSEKEEFSFRVYLSGSLYVSFIAHAIWDYALVGVSHEIPQEMDVLFPPEMIRVLLGFIRSEQGEAGMSRVEIPIALRWLGKALGGKPAQVPIPGYGELMGWKLPGSPFQVLCQKAGISDHEACFREIEAAGLIHLHNGVSYLLAKDVGLIHRIDFPRTWHAVQSRFVNDRNQQSGKFLRSEQPEDTVKRTLDEERVHPDVLARFLDECKRQELLSFDSSSKKWAWIIGGWKMSSQVVADPISSDLVSTAPAEHPDSGESDIHGERGDVMPPENVDSIDSGQIPAISTATERVWEILLRWNPQPGCPIPGVIDELILASEQDGGWVLSRSNIGYALTMLQRRGSVRTFLRDGKTAVELAPEGKAFEFELPSISPKTRKGQILFLLHQQRDRSGILTGAYKKLASILTLTEQSIRLHADALVIAGYIERDSKYVSPLALRLTKKGEQWVTEHSPSSTPQSDSAPAPKHVSIPTLVLPADTASVIKKSASDSEPAVTEFEKRVINLIREARLGRSYFVRAMIALLTSDAKATLSQQEAGTVSRLISIAVQEVRSAITMMELSLNAPIESFADRVRQVVLSDLSQPLSRTTLSAAIRNNKELIGFLEEAASALRLAEGGEWRTLFEKYAV